MKCPKCGGTGWDIVHGFDCVSCDGKGEITMTNEEYIRQCSTEELADFLTDTILSDRRFRMTMVGGIEETKAWLKEIHNG